LENQTWPWNERIHSIFLYDSNDVVDLKCVWFIFACFVLFIFFVYLSWAAVLTSGIWSDPCCSSFSFLFSWLPVRFSLTFISAICYLIYYFDGFFLSFIIIHWLFFIITNCSRRLPSKTKLGYYIWYKLRVLILKEQNNK